jgi:hypothetical protein
MMESNEKIIIAIDKVPMKQPVQPTIGMLYIERSIISFHLILVTIDVKNRLTVIKGKLSVTYLNY